MSLRGPRRRYSLNSVDIVRLFKAKRKRLSAGIIIRQRENGLSYSRLAMSVRRRDYKRAVDRNRIRRLIYESFRHSQGPHQGKDYLVQVGIVPLKRRFSIVRDRLTRFWGSK